MKSSSRSFRRHLAMMGVVGVALFGAAAPAAAQSLEEAVAIAYANNPTIRARREQLRALDEGVNQARSEALPSLGLRVQGTGSSNPRGNPFVNNVGATVSANQTVFTGGRITAGVDAARFSSLAGREQLRGLEQDLLLAVISAYTDVRRDQQALAIRRANVSSLMQQLEQVNAQFRAGDLTRTDQAQAQSRLAGAQALLGQAEAQLTISRANFESIVGQPPAELPPEPTISQHLPPTIQSAIEVAQANNPELGAAVQTERASDRRVTQTRAQRFPQAGVSLSYGAAGVAIDRVPENYNESLTGGFNVTMPLFSGGLISSQVREASATNRADRLFVDGTRLSVVLQVAEAWSQLQAARARIVSGEEQVRAARVAAEGVREEARAGFRTTIDVLNAEQEQRDAELNLVSAQHDEYVANAAILNAIGRLDVGLIAPSAVKIAPDPLPAKTWFLP